MRKNLKSDGYRKTGLLGIFLIVVLSLCIFTACKPGEGQDVAEQMNHEQSQTATAEVEVEVHTSTPIPNLTAEVTPTPVETPTPVPATPVPVVMAIHATPTPEPEVRNSFYKSKYSGVYEMETGLENIINCSVNCVGNTLVMLYSVSDEDNDYYYSVHVRCINPDTGEYRDKAIDTAYYDVSFKYINDEIFAVKDSGYGEYIIYDTFLNEMGTVPEVMDYENGYFSTDGRYIWYLDWEASALFRRDTVTGEFEMLSDEPVLYNGYIRGVDGCPNSLNHRDLREDQGTQNRNNYQNYLNVSWYDDYDGLLGSMLFRMSDGERILTDGRLCNVNENSDGTRCVMISEEPYTMEVFECGVNELFAMDENGTVVLTTEPSCKLDVLNSGEFYGCLVDWDNKVLITETTYYYFSNTVLELSCYSLETGRKISEYSMGLGEEFSSSDKTLDTERELLFFITGRESDTKLYAWDYMNDSADDSNDAFVRFSDIPDDIEQRRRELEGKYNLRIYLGTEVFASQFDYRLSICTNWNMVRDSMTVLDEVFSQYPEGFFEQIKINGIKVLGIYLCAGFEKMYDYSADDAIALACTFGYERALALDLCYDYCLERTIVHEISHWIDTKINSGALFGICQDFEEGWSALNPDGYNYKESYVSGKTIWKYIFDYADSPETAYFTDEYSQTYATEDRAREFEYLMYPSEDYSDFMSSPRIREKLAYYFACIREAFDDTGWPEKTSWELKLEECMNRDPEEM